VTVGLAGLLVAAPAWLRPGRAECPGEEARARATARRIEREWPLRPPDAATAWIQRVGDRLAAAAGPSPYPWRFIVVRDRAPNAFAIGGGRIYVHDGTIVVARSEAEVAAVIAHEMGHELAGHFCEASGPPDRGADFLGGLLGGGRDTKKKRLGSVRQEIDPAKEREADVRSLELLERAGYDPTAALDVARRIASSSSSDARHLGDRRRLDGLGSLVADPPSGGRRDFDRKAFDAARTLVAGPGHSAGSHAGGGSVAPPPGGGAE
jgi:predicted Zn-dependent protease